ncbi:hypothetical protein Hanom_Chr01g00087871 [Helianthus anomalus]
MLQKSRFMDYYYGGWSSLFDSANGWLCGQGKDDSVLGLGNGVLERFAVVLLYVCSLEVKTLTQSLATIKMGHMGPGQTSGKSTKVYFQSIQHPKSLLYKDLR